MKWTATVVVFSQDAPASDPIILNGAKVEMKYDYVDHLPGNGLIPLDVQIKWEPRNE